jgi:hypothetical protein
MMQELAVRRHGGLGVTSFIIGVLSIFVDLGIFGVAGYLKQSGQQTPAVNMIVGSCILLLLGVCLLGLGLGIAGAADRTSKKIFPIFGIIICAAVFLLTCALVDVGIWMVRQGGG